MPENIPADPELTQVRLRDFYRRAGDMIIPTDDREVYLPDLSWTKTFAEGLELCGFSDKRVLEVGVGSGINMAGLLTCKTPPRDFIGTDIAPNAVSASRRLADDNNMRVTLVQSDLLSGVDEDALRRVDHIIGCIPQVPRHKGEAHDEREFSDYYEETGIKEDAFGLGLVARLLDQIIEHAPYAAVTLNIAGRPGKTRSRELFADRNMANYILHSNIVRQDPHTCLESLVEIERKTGRDFHFYADSKEKQAINAREAEARRVAGTAIFHSLYVIRAGLSLNQSRGCQAGHGDRYRWHVARNARPERRNEDPGHPSRTPATRPRPGEGRRTSAGAAHERTPTINADPRIAKPDRQDDNKRGG